MAEIQAWNPTDNSNTDLFPENMAFNLVNNGGRSVQGLLARWYQDTNGSLASSGAANAFSVTSVRTIGALFDGLLIGFTANHAITGASTLNLNGLGAKDIKRINNFSLVPGDIVSGQPVFVVYKLAADDWFMLSASSAVDWAVGSPTTLVDAATIAIDMLIPFNFVVTLGGNRTLGAPTNTTVNKCGLIDVLATGSTRTLALNAVWKVNAGVVFPISVAVGSLVTIYYRVRSSTFIEITGLWTGAST